MTPESIDVLNLPTMPLAEKKHLPTCQALYFVLDENNAILYIGRTNSLRTRFSMHHKVFPSTSVIRIAWLAVEDDMCLQSLEQESIVYFKPPKNGQCLPEEQKKRPGIHEYALRIPKTLFEEFALAAKADKRSVNVQLEILMERWLAESQQRQNHEASLSA